MRRRSTRLERFEQRVRDFAAAHGLFAGCERAVAAVSGGPDSMAMMYALVRIRAATGEVPPLVVAHLDHALRGDASTADAEFVRAAARGAGLESVVRRVDVAAEAAARSTNIEAFARDVRYAFLAHVAESHAASAIATAHTASDQAETVLMRLARGTGPDGVSGIRISRPLGAGAVPVVRPLLAVTRADVLAYCRDREIAFRIDATNEDLDRTRAAIRHTVLPELERLSPGAAANLARTAEIAAEDRALLDELAGRAFDACADAADDRITLDAAGLTELARPLRRRVLREAVRRTAGDLRRVTFDHVEALAALAGPGRDGRELQLPGGLAARRTGNHVVLYQTVEK